ncbi:MAG: apolipoprotein N-acyltransferase [Planctomycetaceae bacterium]
MAVKTMSTQSKRQHTVRITEPSVQQIIAKARAKTVRASSKGAWLLSGATALMLWASFTPLDWGPLGWIALVPLILLVRLEQRTYWMYGAIYTTSLINMLATLQWMRLGHQTMYPAWVALSIYVAMYLPVFVLLAHTAVHRFRVPLTLAVPVVWVGLEFVRAHLLTGFSWYYLAHTQYRWIELIQISDITGAYGVSFLVAMTSAALAGFLPKSLFARLKLLVPSAGPQPPDDAATTRRKIIAVAAGLTVFAVALSYGYVRRSQADFREGPRVALVQGNFTSEVKQDDTSSERIFFTHRNLTGAIVAHQPDLIVWPETMYRSPLYNVAPGVSDEELKAIAPPVKDLDLTAWVDLWRDRRTPRSLLDLSQEAGAPMIIGIDALEANREKFRHYNSAVFVHPQQGLLGRYDKLHRVPFGEFIPFRDTFPFLQKLTPFGDHQFGIAAGSKPIRFDDTTRGWSYAPLICFEDTVPHVVRRIVSSSAAASPEHKPVDCLVNLTNDGWFHGSSELDQHLITAVFRSVECRTPMVRAVNTGVSAYIDGDGVILEPDVFIDGDGKGRKSLVDPKTGRWHKQLNAALVHPIPLDNRSSLYVRWGDWFAGMCFAGVLLATCGTFAPRRKRAG